jgi:hypothetical protein
VTAALNARKLLDSLLEPVRRLWLGMHFVYGCVEGTALALVLIAQLRWKMRDNYEYKEEK